MPSGASALPTEFFEWQDAPRGDFAVIGDPISHSLSPVMHQAAYRALHLELTYRAIRVAPGQVGTALAHLSTLGYRGVNVTVPHKQEAFAWCSQTDEFSSRVGAVNTIDLRDRQGINTDGPGFLDTVLPLVADGSRVLILGAGGSARSIALALAELDFTLAIYNRTQARAEDLVISLGIDATLLDRPTAKGFDLIVNTTSASLSGEGVEIDWSEAEPGLAYDLVYGGSPFLEEASVNGWRTVDGLSLLVAQGARSFEWWLGLDAPREAMTEAVRCAS